MSISLTTLMVQDVDAVCIERIEFRGANGALHDFDVVEIIASGLKVKLFTTPGGLANLAPITPVVPAEEAA